MLDRDGILTPVEIKKTATPALSDIKAFAKVKALGLPIGDGAVVCPATAAIPLSDCVKVIPVGSL